MKDDKGTFYKYNPVTGKKEYIYIDKSKPKPIYHCERCGEKKIDVSVTSQGHYHYLCKHCYDICFHWNGNILEFTEVYNDEWLRITNELLLDETD